VRGIPWSLARLALAGLALGFVPRADAGPAGPEVPDVRAWLGRIHEAANLRNYHGTFVVSAGGILASTRVAHYCDGRNQFERLETLGGPMKWQLRHNDVVHTLWPKGRVASIEQRDVLTSFPALLQGSHEAIADHYVLRVLGTDRVAGYETDVLQLSPRDAYRYGYRLWADQRSALLLRAEVLGPTDEVLESAAFSELSIGVKPQPESVLQPMRQLNGWRVVRPLLTRTRLESEGWMLRPALPGFREISCVRRTIDSPVDSQAATAAAPAIQSIWSDGLTYVSVFIEAYEPQRHTRPMQTTMGATQTLMRRHGDWWVTLMGEVPAATLRQFANTLERQR